MRTLDATLLWMIVLFGVTGGAGVALTVWRRRCEPPARFAYATRQRMIGGAVLCLAVGVGALTVLAGSATIARAAVAMSLVWITAGSIGEHLELNRKGKR